MKIHANGYWITTPEDRRVPHYFDEGLASLLVKWFANVSVLDLGCGDGRYVNALAGAGIQAMGLDGNPLTTEIAGIRCNVADLTQPLPPGALADFVLSLEVAEHIPPGLEFEYVANLHRANRCGVVLSWAVRGQKGNGHVNCRNNAEVCRLFELLGYSLDDRLTAQIRAVATLDWFKNTLLFFWRKAAP